MCAYMPAWTMSFSVFVFALERPKRCVAKAHCILSADMHNHRNRAHLKLQNIQAQCRMSSILRLHQTGIQLCLLCKFFSFSRLGGKNLPDLDNKFGFLIGLGPRLRVLVVACKIYSPSEDTARPQAPPKRPLCRPFEVYFLFLLKQLENPNTEKPKN